MGGGGMKEFAGYDGGMENTNTGRWGLFLRSFCSLFVFVFLCFCALSLDFSSSSKTGEDCPHPHPQGTQVHNACRCEIKTEDTKKKALATHMIHEKFKAKKAMAHGSHI